MNISCNKMFSFKIILFIWILNVYIEAKNVQKRGVMDDFGSGLKFAGQMLGINTAADVANLVAKAFSKTTTTNSAKQNMPDFMSIFQQRPSSTHEQNEYQQDWQQQDADASQEQQQQASSENVLPRPPPKEDVGIVDFTTTKFLTNMLKMIGFDASKLGALAINALIMVAQAIGNALMGGTFKNQGVTSLDGGRLFGSNSSAGPEAEHDKYNDHQPRKLRDGSPIDWFLENPSADMKYLLDNALNSNFSEKLTNIIANLETDGNEGACLKMLMCKSSPFIFGMQKSLKQRFNKATQEPSHKNAAPEKGHENELFNTNAFFTHLPSVAEYRDHGVECEERYADYCNTMDFYKNRQKYKTH